MPILRKKDGPPNAAQVGRFYMVARDHGLDEGDVVSPLGQYGVEHVADLTIADYDALTNQVMPSMGPPDPYGFRSPTVPGRATDPHTGEVYEDELSDWPAEVA